ncbi:hypothetical protein M0804_002088 [Polistes exclamans]|nr:hypothetical protein M0804_002088 [Polistes exclamans]
MTTFRGTEDNVLAGRRLRKVYCEVRKYRKRGGCGGSCGDAVKDGGGGGVVVVVLLLVMVDVDAGGIGSSSGSGGGGVGVGEIMSLSINKE